MRIIVAAGVIATAVITAYALGDTDDAKAQTLPAGTYRKTCTGIEFTGRRLTARCRDLSGGSHRAEIPDVRKCVGDIWNYEGKLYCSDAKVPTGPYLVYCTNPFTQDGTLHALCPTAAPGTARLDVALVKLDTYLRCLANTIWWDGKLTCDHPKITRQVYAAQCEKLMGPIGTINCLAGDEIPVFSGGKPITEMKLPKKNASGATVQDCDNPALLPLKNASGSQCVPGSRLQVLKTDANVIAVVLCRKYRTIEGVTPVPPERFHDVAVIQHRTDTGETCFHQTKTQWDPGTGIDGKSIPPPSSGDPAADKLWLQPNAGNFNTTSLQLGVGLGLGLATTGGHYNCVSCHDANPFIWTPYIARGAKGFANWNPQGPYNPFIGGMFGYGATSIAPEGNACTQCHRIGVRSWIELRKAHATHTGGKSFEHVMPPGKIDGYTTPHAPMTANELAFWNKDFGDSITQLDKCIIGNTSNPFPFLTDKSCKPYYSPGLFAPK